MRFRGKMTNAMSIRQFAHLTHILARCSKQLVIRLCSDRINFIVCERESRIQNNNGPTAWCDLPENFFQEYGMEGLSPDANEILLEMPSDALAGAMNNLRNSISVTSLKIKLTRKNVPCITIEIQLAPLNFNFDGVDNPGTDQLCVHDIPVALIKKEDWGDYKEPELPAFDVSFGLPDLRIVQRSLDRMKSMAFKVNISASKYGQLYFAVDKLGVKSTVKFKELMKVYELGEERDGASTQNSANSHTNFFAVEVDMRSLLLLLPQEQMKPSSMICSILHERQLHLFFIYGEITLQYFLPCSAV